MFVVTIALIKKGLPGESLSYFSASGLEPGSIITVPFRKGSNLGLVLSSEPAIESKARLRSQEFALRKIGEIGGDRKNINFLDVGWMEAAQEFANYSAVPLGQVVSHLVPAIVFKNIESLSKNISKQEIKEEIKINRGSVEILQDNDKARFSHYKTVVREEFARKKSVFLCLSTNEEIEEAKKVFEKGIEKYTFVFQAKMGEKNFKNKFKEILETPHPILIIASYQWLFLRRGDMGTVILDGENSSSWRGVEKPFLDFKKFVEIFCLENSKKFLLGDIAISTESFWKYGDIKFKNLPFSVSDSNMESEIVDLRRSKRGIAGESVFTILSEEVLDLIGQNKEKNKNMFVYVTRKGLSAVTVCRDCGQEVLCHNCDSPVVLYKRADINIFKCKQCGEIRNAQEICKNCSSWRLLPLGIGVERVREEIEKNFAGEGSLKIFEVNKDATPTHAKAKVVVEKFYKSPGAVLIGTEMALNYLKEQVDFSVIASIDSLFSVPDFRIREKILRLLLRARSLAREKFTIQARNAERQTLQMALSGNLSAFYKREIKEREELKYPPFSVFIKVTVRGVKNFVGREMEILRQIFENFKPIIFESNIERESEPSAMNCIIKIASENYPNEEIRRTIVSLPPHFDVKINPDNLL